MPSHCFLVSQHAQGGYYAPLYAPIGGRGSVDYPGGAGLMGGSPLGGGTVSETCQIAVPNAAVGAIIGTAGVNIKQMMRDSGATITVSLPSH